MRAGFSFVRLWAVLLVLTSPGGVLPWPRFNRVAGAVVNAFRASTPYPDPNRVFFADFFTIMIFVDVFLLLVSFMYHFTFFSVFRNASFVITTILISTA